MLGSFSLELSLVDGPIRVTRYGYRKAMAIDRFLTISGRCGEKVSREIAQFQQELDDLAGHKGAPDNHCTYEVYNDALGGYQGPLGMPVFVVTFHDDYVYFGKGIRKGDW